MDATLIVSILASSLYNRKPYSSATLTQIKRA